MTSVGDLLVFGQLFVAFGNNYFTQISPHFLAIFAKVSKSIIFSTEIFGQLLKRFGDFFLVTLLVTHVWNFARAG